MGGGGGRIRDAALHGMDQNRGHPRCLVCPARAVYTGRHTRHKAGS